MCKTMDQVDYDHVHNTFFYVILHVFCPISSPLQDPIFKHAAQSLTLT